MGPFGPAHLFSHRCNRVVTIANVRTEIAITTAKSFHDTNDINHDTYLVNVGFVPSTSEQIYTKHVVSIRNTKIQHTFGENHVCGGSILAPGLILTAAYCLFIPGHGPMDPADIEVVAGTPNRLRRVQTTQSIKADELILHPRYASEHCDIALIKLTNDLKLDNYSASAIALPKHSPLEGEQCFLLGWGHFYENGPMADEILYSVIGVLTYETCKKKLLITEGNICAFDYSHVLKGACKGDSGGPLICHGAVSGIVESKMDCDFGVPNVLTNVYYFLEWIEANGGKMIYFHYLLLLFFYPLNLFIIIGFENINFNIV
uniref:Peptidase S1 domain-containing protein n=1 Tax=Glossina brevipalpis TaxID=37001 RepID=A0A1A9X131_9MUSC